MFGRMMIRPELTDMITCLGRRAGDDEDFEQLQRPKYARFSAFSSLFLPNSHISCLLRPLLINITASPATRHCRNVGESELTL